jgi:cholesterol oxidase
MAGFDYDVVVVGSGFGGSVAAFRAAEKGYRVGVMESGKRWNDEDVPKTNRNLTHFTWQPEMEMYGIQRIEYLDDVLVLSGARFDITTGAIINGPTTEPLNTYEVKVAGGEIQARV